MADEREPPPLSGLEQQENSLFDDNDEDLFASVAETAPKLERIDLKDDEDEEERDIFADANTEVSLDSPVETAPVIEVEETLSAQSEIPTVPATMEPEPQLFVGGESSFNKTREPQLQQEEIDEELGEDTFCMEIKITDPMKRGDGMGAYMAYRVNTSTNSSNFRSSEMSVYRRFSDFLGLHDKLVEKHQHEGRIIPPAPEKSVMGMTKIKMSKDDQSTDFVEKRRAQLERFLNRISKHDELRQDPDYIEFLEKDDELPKSTSTSALSGAGVLRLFSKVGDSINKIAFHMNETDEWFEKKQEEIDSLDHQFRKLHSSLEALVMYRKDLALNTGHFSRSVAMVGNTEENTSLSRALSQLAEIEEKIEQLHQDEADNDFYVLSELVKDYVQLISAIKDVFGERVKIFKAWKDAELMLNKKREEKAKLELQRKLDKVPAIAQECTRLDGKADRYKEEFEQISKNIKKEIIRFEKQRVKDFKASIINYLETLLNSQQQLIKYWESFLPEAKAIA